MIENIIYIIVHWSTILVGMIGVYVILIGIVHCFGDFLKIETHHPKKITHNAIRSKLGIYLLLGLEFLIAADILETVFNPSLAQLGLLGGIVLIRTVLNHFLNKELESIELENNLQGDK